MMKGTTKEGEESIILGLWNDVDFWRSEMIDERKPGLFAHLVLQSQPRSETRTNKDRSYHIDTARNLQCEYRYTDRSNLLITSNSVEAIIETETVFIEASFFRTGSPSIDLAEVIIITFEI